MKKDALYQLATDICHDVLQKNQTVINERTVAALERQADSDGKFSPSNASAALSAVALTLVPELSAVITARMLVELGLIEIEEEE